MEAAHSLARPMDLFATPHYRIQNLSFQACREQSKKIWKMFRKYVRIYKFIPIWVFEWMDDIAKLTSKTIFLRRVLAEAMSSDFQFRVQRCISYRRMVRTKKSYLGLALALAHTGDHVALLKGLRTPVVLRPNREVWEFVGDCYVHGIMNGEAFQEEQGAEIWLA